MYGDEMNAGASLSTALMNSAVDVMQKEALLQRKRVMLSLLPQ